MNPTDWTNNIYSEMYFICIHPTYMQHAMHSLKNILNIHVNSFEYKHKYIKISKNRILAVHRRFAHRFNKGHFQRKWPPIFRANNRWVQLSSSISYNTSGRHQL